LFYYKTIKQRDQTLIKPKEYLNLRKEKKPKQTMQNSFTFNGFNSIDLMNQSSFSTPTTSSNASSDHRRASVGCFYRNQENQSLLSPLMQQTQSNFFSGSMGDFQANQSLDANSSFQQSSLSSEAPSFGQYIQVTFYWTFLRLK
jgi:hypothetical protein